VREDEYSTDSSAVHSDSMLGIIAQLSKWEYSAGRIVRVRFDCILSICQLTILSGYFIN